MTTLGDVPADFRHTLTDQFAKVGRVQHRIHRLAVGGFHFLFPRWNNAWVPVP